MFHSSPLHRAERQAQSVLSSPVYDRQLRTLEQRHLRETVRLDGDHEIVPDALRGLAEIRDK